MAKHQWRFFRAGGIDQVQLKTGADLLALDQLDQKLWLALACPVKGIEFDERTLQLIDGDGDNRVRASELIAAIKWAAGALNDVEELASTRDVLPLSAIREVGPHGAPLQDAARGMLRALGKPAADFLSVEDAVEATSAFDKQPWNGDGVVPAASAEAPADIQLIADVLACTAEPAIDRSGEPGVHAEGVAAFFDALAEYLAWLDAGQADQLRPLGDQTAEAAAAFEAIQPKVDDFFARARVAAFDARALDAINREQSDYLTLAARDLRIDVEEMTGFPLAAVGPTAPLPLKAGINPAWADRLEALYQQVIEPLFGPLDALDEAQWREVCRAFQPYQDWQAAKAGAQVEALPEARLRELAGGDARARLDALIARDLAEKPKADAIAKVEKLARYSRDLMGLANNFVAFKSFYAREAPATFQVGTLYIDQRSCELCVDVADPARHATMAPHAQAYLLYCDLKNAAGEKRSIVAAMTNGDQDNMMVGRNGVFYDRDGNDWDATVTRLVENPISIRQAFWAPYKKFLRLVEAHLTKRAQASEAAADARLLETFKAAGQAVSGDGKSATPPKPLDIGVLAAIGVGVSGGVAAMGLLLEAFFGLGVWMPLGVLGLMLLISGPSMLIAWLKLRQRNLAPLLDANGWAVNARARINVPLGRSLTQVAHLPDGSSRDVVDPFADKKRPWPAYAFITALLLSAAGWYLGYLDVYLPPRARSVNVMGEAAPAIIHEVRKEKAKALAEAAAAEDEARAKAAKAQAQGDDAEKAAPKNP